MSRELRDGHDEATTVLNILNNNQTIHKLGLFHRKILGSQ